MLTSPKWQEAQEKLLSWARPLSAETVPRRSSSSEVPPLSLSAPPPATGVAPGSYSAGAASTRWKSQFTKVSA